MLSFTLSGNISIDNHQWRLSQAYTYAFHISIHIHIAFITYHLYIPIACKSFPLHVLCLWHISYLCFYCIPVSILCIFHIHSITYCSMSLAYLLSILLLYSCFYTLHIPYSFYYLLFYVFGISPIYTFTIISYTVIGFHIYFHVLPYTIVFIYLSYTILYCHVLCICVFTLTIELTFTTYSRGNLVLFVIQ